MNYLKKIFLGSLILLFLFSFITVNVYSQDPQKINKQEIKEKISAWLNEIENLQKQIIFLKNKPDLKNSEVDTVINKIDDLNLRIQIYLNRLKNLEPNNKKFQNISLDLDQLPKDVQKLNDKEILEKEIKKINFDKINDNYNIYNSYDYDRDIQKCKTLDKYISKITDYNKQIEEYGVELQEIKRKNQYIIDDEKKRSLDILYSQKEGVYFENVEKYSNLIKKYSDFKNTYCVSNEALFTNYNTLKSEAISNAEKLTENIEKLNSANLDTENLSEYNSFLSELNSLINRTVSRQNSSALQDAYQKLSNKNNDAKDKIKETDQIIDSSLNNNSSLKENSLQEASRLVELIIINLSLLEQKNLESNNLKAQLDNLKSKVDEFSKIDVLDSDFISKNITFNNYIETVKLVNDEKTKILDEYVSVQEINEINTKYNKYLNKYEELENINQIIGIIDSDQKLNISRFTENKNSIEQLYSLFINNQNRSNYNNFDEKYNNTYTQLENKLTEINSILDNLNNQFVNSRKTKIDEEIIPRISVLEEYVNELNFRFGDYSKDDLLSDYKEELQDIYTKINLNDNEIDSEINLLPPEIINDTIETNKYIKTKLIERKNNLKSSADLLTDDLEECYNIMESVYFNQLEREDVEFPCDIFLDQMNPFRDSYFDVKYNFVLNIVEDDYLNSETREDIYFKLDEYEINIELLKFYNQIYEEYNNN
jgi:uncharacterized protein YukE